MMAMEEKNHFLFNHQPCLDWDLHNFELEDLHVHMPLVMESPLSSLSSEASTGYLQDAVTEWSDRCKRRRTTTNTSTAVFCPKDFEFELPSHGFDDLLQGFWDSSTCHEEDDPLNFLLQDNNSYNNHKAMDPLKEEQEEEKDDGVLAHHPTKNQHEEKEQPKPSHQFTTLKQLALKESNIESSSTMKASKKKQAMGVVYPFAVVKPGGLEEEVTLEDINERLLMRPSRPVRHPVGEFACLPCVSGDGPGLSGKAVVGLTRIHTQGRGTITIIRTRG
ncbi:hypothetical protein IHE45_18G057900 [Dioscorea alata]|uniref:Uncharacterized protein n=1 Tax=Dioscorea alata TaxID=55571 RepID=A0ACB7U789_DIOAL|nr:hypothetical protein IHE45_18G057900 [Dioscorea alata]